MIKLQFISVLSFLLSVAVDAQVRAVPETVLSQRIAVAPDNVVKMFREAGMDPVNHEMTAVEMEKIDYAFSLLPPLHQKMINSHVHSISFMDNMPNTALTSPVELEDPGNMFNITFRAEILHETISEWATWKENKCFDRGKNPEYTVLINGGNLDAFLYVLLHEVTHVVDAVLEITPHPKDKEAPIEPTPYTRNVWQRMNMPDDKFVDSLLEKTVFRGGGRVSIALSPEIYKTLKRTPFASLYAMASWFEDIAELEAIYHLTHKLKQPFYVVVSKEGSELIRFEPMANKKLKKRLYHLERSYSKK